MTDQEAIAALDAIEGEGVDGDNHDAADKLLLELVSPEGADAYRRLQLRAEGWWFAWRGHTFALTDPRWFACRPLARPAWFVLPLTSPRQSPHVVSDHRSEGVGTS